MEINHPRLGKFIILREIGHGVYSSVYLGRHLQTNFLVAIKVFADNYPYESSLNEFNVFSEIIHPFICQEFDLFTTETGEVCLLIEFVHGTTLLHYANHNSPLSTATIKLIIGQIIIALEFLHDRNITHRDLKCDNILIDRNNNVRIIDFGFASETENHQTLCGSYEYLAPEIILQQNYGKAVDVWSLGIILYAIYFGHLPFESHNLQQLLTMICEAEPDLHNDISCPDLVHLITRMLDKNPETRITIDQIKTHRFFTSDENGNSYFFDSHCFESLIDVKQPIHFLLDKLRLPQDQKNKCIDDLKKGNRTKDTIAYLIIRKDVMSSCALFGKGHLFLKNQSNATVDEFTQYPSNNHFHIPKSTNNLISRYPNENINRPPLASYKTYSSQLLLISKESSFKYRSNTLLQKTSLVANHIDGQPSQETLIKQIERPTVQKLTSSILLNFPSQVQRKPFVSHIPTKPIVPYLLSRKLLLA